MGEQQKPQDQPLPPTPVFLSTHAGKAPEFPTEVVIGSPLDLCVTGCVGFAMQPYKVWLLPPAFPVDPPPHAPSPKIQEIPDTPPRERRIVIDEP